jgi:quercetin dioxygenase-like cupin family protein
MQIVKCKDVEEEKNAKGTMVRKLLVYPDASIIMITLKPGNEVAPHVTPVDVFFYIIEGSGDVQIGKEVQEVHADEIIFSPKNIEHSLKNTKNNVFRFLVVKTPTPK